MMGSIPMPDGAPLILCIEDEDALRRDLVEELQDAGYRVIEAADGADALLQLESFRPNLILCDISMPGMDGYDLLQHLQARDDDYSDVPFIFLTALADRHEVLEGKRRGADDYLIKPVDFDLLLATVHARLRQISRIREHSRLVPSKAVLRLAAGAHIDTAASDPNIAAVLDILSTAVILINDSRQLVFTNQAARRFIDDCSEFRLILNQLGRGQAHRTNFSAWLDTMLAEQEDGHVGSFAFPRREEETDAKILGCKLYPQGGSQPMLALFMTSAADTYELSPEILASLFGFTPTESLIAVALARGDRPAEISALLGSAQTTVAFHIRNIFQKTGVSRQASLVALLLTSPASLF